MAVRVRPSRRLIRDDLPTLERPEKATWRRPLTGSGWAWPSWPMAPANSTDLIRIGVASHAPVRAASHKTAVSRRDAEKLRELLSVPLRLYRETAVGSACLFLVEEAANPVGKRPRVGVAARQRL